MPKLNILDERSNIIPKKSLGQNFLIDPNILEKISKLDSSLSNFRILEIGPGYGALTKSLLNSDVQKVFAIEKDHRFDQALKDIKYEFPDRFDYVIGDVLEFDYSFLYGKNLKIFSNLPYNISTKLLVKWLKDNVSSLKWQSLMLMFQREVAERIVAKCGSKNYGRLSILSNLMADVTKEFDISKNCFRPKPKVMSSMVRLEALESPRVTCNFEVLEKIVFLAFSQRRKILKNSLKSLHPEIDTLMKESGICPNKRAETIKLSQYGALSLKL